VSIAKANVRNDNDVLPLFQAHYAGLNAHGMTRPMLLSKLSDMPTAEESQRTIVRYGQQDDNVWVVSNLAFSGGICYPLKHANYSVDRAFFGNHPRAPWPEEDHPKVMHIPFAHVRYRLFSRFWNVLMPYWFAHNAVQAPTNASRRWAPAARHWLEWRGM